MLWRDAQTGKQTSLAFPAGRDRVSRDAARQLADGFKARLDLDGVETARDWLERQGAAGEQSAAPAWTLDRWMDHYLEHLTSVTEGTRDEYRKLYRRTWSEHLGALPIDLVNRDAVADAVNALTRRLSQKSMENARGLLSAAFNAAIEHDEVPVRRNPVRGVRLPRGTYRANLDGEDDDGEHCYLSHAEFEQLYEQIPAHWQPLVLTLVLTGMRWSEATALPISALNLVYDDHSPASARIFRAWKRVPGGWQLGPPKTEASRRTVLLPNVLADVLAGVVAGRSRRDFVFLSRNGRSHVHGPNFRQRVWLPAIERSGLDRRPRIHDLRHTHVSWLIAEGIDLAAIQQRLGHESITTTVGTYGDLMPESRIRAAVAAGAVLHRLNLPQIERG